MDSGSHEQPAARETAATLAARCAARLSGPEGTTDVDAHLDELRRCLARRDVPAAGARARAAIDAVRSRGAGWTDDSPALRRDLHGLDHALERAARIGGTPRDPDGPDDPGDAAPAVGTGDDVSRRATG